MLEGVFFDDQTDHIMAPKPGNEDPEETRMNKTVTNRILDALGRMEPKPGNEDSEETRINIEKSSGNCDGDEDPQHGAKLALVLVTLLSVFLFSGIIFGWAALLHIYRAEGYYADECAKGDDWCNEQQDALTLIYTVGSSGQEVVAIFVGLLQDNVGLRPAIAVGCLNMCIGLYLMLCFDSPVGIPEADITTTLLTGVCFLVTGSMGLFQHAFTVAPLFLSKIFLIVASVSTLFDASSLIFVLVKMVYDAGVPLYAIGLFQIALCIITCGVMFYLRTIVQQPGPPPKENLNPALLKSKRFGSTGKDLVCSLEFAVVWIFMAVNMTRSNLYVGMIAPFFESISSSNVNTFITIATFIVPAGCFFTPVVECVIESLGGAGAFLVVHIVAVAYTGLNFIPLLWVQLLATILFGFYRALLFSATSAFNLQVFGVSNLGRINGVMYSTTGMISFLISPMITWAASSGYDILNGVQLAALVFSLAGVVALYYYSVEPFVRGPKAVDLFPQEVAAQKTKDMTRAPRMATFSEGLEAFSQEFTIIDADGSGTISKDEFEQMYGATSTAKFKAIDTDSSGFIDMNEYQAARQSGTLAAPSACK